MADGELTGWGREILKYVWGCLRRQDWTEGWGGNPGVREGGWEAKGPEAGGPGWREEVKAGGSRKHGNRGEEAKTPSGSPESGDPRGDG